MTGKPINLQRLNHCYAPASNLAEVGHVKMASHGGRCITLVEASRYDVVADLRQDAELFMFRSGLCKGGRGPTYKQKRAKEFQAELKRAASFGYEVAMDLDQVSADKPTMFVQKKGKHSPPRKKSKPVVQKRDEETKAVCHLELFGRVKNLKKCYGCKKLFTKKYKNPPYNMIL